MNPGRANRLAFALVAVGVVGIALVLGLWQGVDTACEGAGFDPAEPVSTCAPPTEVEVSPVVTDPQSATLVDR